MIADFKNKGKLIFGPFPADGFFGSGQHEKYDGLLAMYHDISDLVQARLESPEETAQPEAEAEVVAPRERTYAIEEIEGIGPAYGEKVGAVGIRTTADLLKFAASRKGREELAEQTAISGSLILEWVNRADLMRVPGIGEEYSDLLETAGVDTVKEREYRIRPL